MAVLRFEGKTLALDQPALSASELLSYSYILEASEPLRFPFFWNWEYSRVAPTVMAVSLTSEQWYRRLASRQCCVFCPVLRPSGRFWVRKMDMAALSFKGMNVLKN